MKKYIAVVLCVLLMFSLSACGTPKSENAQADSTAAQGEDASAQKSALAIYARYSGEWNLAESEYENAAPAETAPIVKIWEDGTFVAYEEDGTEVTRGYLAVEPEEIEDTTVTWVNLYNEADEYYLGFADEGEESPSEFYVGNGAVDHYVRAE